MNSLHEFSWKSTGTYSSTSVRVQFVHTVHKYSKHFTSGNTVRSYFQSIDAQNIIWWCSITWVLTKKSIFTAETYKRVLKTVYVQSAQTSFKLEEKWIVKFKPFGSSTFIPKLFICNISDRQGLNLATYFQSYEQFNLNSLGHPLWPMTVHFILDFSNPFARIP